MRKPQYALSLVVVAAAIAFFAYALPGLPDEVPVHWNLQGAADRYGSPWELFAAGPGVMTLVIVLFAALPWLSPRRFEVGSFAGTCLNLMLIIVGMVGYVFVLALWAALHGGFDLQRSVMGGLAVLMVLMGNLLGKVRRNFFIGIRTPWTLASERVWYDTHRLAAYAVVIGGLLALAAALAGAPPWIGIALITTSVLVPAIYSLVHYKQLEKRGQA